MFTRPNTSGTAWQAVAYFILVAGVVSLLAGLGGAGLAWFLHESVHLLYGTRSETLPEITAHTTPRQRFLVLAAAGVAMAALWWAIRRWGPHPPNPEQAAAGASMSPGWTIAEALIEVGNVGAGASIGRESAPREVGAMVADRISAWTRLHPDERSVLIACAAGAGLAATYNVPVAGAIFGIETVLGISWLRRTPFGHLAIILPVALGVSYGAVFAGHLIVARKPLYQVDYPTGGSLLSLLAVAAVLGLGLGPLGHFLGRLFSLATQRSPRGNRLLLLMPLAYLALAGLVAWQPAVMGNGKVLAQGAFDQQFNNPSLLLLIVLKPVATTLTMGAGARGGRITPSFSTGAAAGMLTAIFWSRFFPLSLEGATLTGGGVMLATATGSPLAAFSLAMEMTAAPWRMALPLGLAIFLGWGITRLIERAERTRNVLPDAPTIE
ncbi:MAG TPA: chloride channel protein [Thermomicrobiales bacterium]|nr:chloride channel protein [Thermomicrobiales bacterium]